MGYGLAMQLEAYDPARAGDESLPYAPEEWERLARAALDDGPFGYVAGGAGGDDTVRANREAFRRRHLWPRVLRDVSRRDLSLDLSLDLLGARLPAPVLLAPVGVLGVLHPDAERAPARAAASLGIPFVLSTVS